MKRKTIRYRSLPVILAVFLTIGLMLFAERSGIRSKSSKIQDSYVKGTVVTSREAEQELEPESLVIMNSGSEDSVNAAEQFRQIFRDMKVGYTLIDVSEDKIPDFGKYSTVTILLSDLTDMKDSLTGLCDWVEQGGRAMFALTIQKNTYSDMIERKLGILSSSYENTLVDSIYPEEEFMIGGGKDFAIADGFESAWAVEVGEQVKVHAHTGDDKKTPIVWENSYGQGKFVVINLGLYEKATRGFFAASYSLLEDTFVYPVINASMFFLDDFPSPVPGGDGTYIKRDYGMNTANFYTNVWWPDMMRLSDKYGVRYTGVMIENYEDNTSDAIQRAEDTQRFQYFGNMLLHQGGEIGFHGYNHQPLSLENVDYGDVLPYNTWESYKAMRDGFEELLEFGKEQFPAAKMSVYVPPSNVLSEEGRRMIAEEFPEIKTIASNYFSGEYAYVQEFETADDGLVEEPRIISGCQLEEYMQMAALSELNMHFVNSHFLHPDDLLDVDRGAKIGWEKLKSNLDHYMEWLYTSAPPIRNLTGSEAAGAIQRFGALTVHKEETQEEIKLSFGHFDKEAYVMVRVNEGKVGKVTGGTIEHLGGGLYLLHAESENVVIERTFKEE